MMTIFMAPRAAACLDVVKQLALGVIRKFSAFDGRGRVGAFEAGRKVGLLFVGRAGIAGRVLAGLELVLSFLSGCGWVAFAFILGVQ